MSDVVLINAHNIGPRRYAWPGQVAQLRQSGKATNWARFVPKRLWMQRRRSGPTLIHRLDGVAKLIRGVKSTADRLQPAINQLVDYTVFQSSYSEQVFSDVGVLPGQSQVIHNGVDPKIFYPRMRKPRNDRVLRLVGASWSQNPRKGFATLAEFSRIPNVEIRFVGRWCPSIDSANVNCLGPKSSSEVAELMRHSDAMVHAAINEPCSNAILEGLACGLPVLYRDSGGNRELAGDYGMAISDNLADDIQRLRLQYDDLRQKVLKNRWRFLIDHVAPRYLEAFEYARESQGRSPVPPPGFQIEPDL